jgi:hypothetical protein
MSSRLRGLPPEETSPVLRQSGAAVILAIASVALFETQVPARRLTFEAWPALKDAKGSVALMSGNSSPGARWMTGSTLRMDGGEVKSI